MTDHVQFTPSLTKAGKYKVYLYLPRLEKSASQVGIQVFDGKTSQETLIKPADVVVVGQTSGEWVALGEYQLPAGKSAHVAIKAKQIDGQVAADAVLFVPAFH